MTAQQPPIFLQAGSHPAEDVRRFIGTAVSTPGLVSAGDLVVTERAGTASMSVDVAGGRAFLAGNEATYQGTYFVENRGVANLVVSAAHGSLTRYDLVVARIQDAAYSGASNSWSLAVITGTPASTPLEPAVPASSFVLARITVGAAVSSITNAAITDRRLVTAGQGYATTLGGQVTSTSTMRPSAPTDGMRIYETDTHKHMVYYAVAGVWRQPWGEPWGLQGMGYRTTTLTGITTTVDIGFLTVTFVAVANRRYKIHCVGEVASTVADGAFQIFVQANGTTIKRATGDLSTSSRTKQVTVIHTPVAGSITYKIQLSRAGGSGSLIWTAAIDNPSQITVEDIGPNGNPA